MARRIPFDTQYREVVVRRRICLVGAAVCAFPLAFGVAAAAAAKSHKPPAAKKAQAVKVTCTTNVAIMIADGETSVVPPVAQGTEYGSARCGKQFGGGVQSDTFTIPDSGDTVAKFVLYFREGSIHGTYDLSPQETSLNFLETDYKGTLKVAGGTGAFKGFKGTGTSTCKTLDGIHTSCKDHLKLKAPATS